MLIFLVASIGSLSSMLDLLAFYYLDVNLPVSMTTILFVTVMIPPCVSVRRTGSCEEDLVLVGIRISGNNIMSVKRTCFSI